MDHIASTPLHPQVLEEMLPVLKQNFGNPQSVHSFGQAAAQFIETAREKVAALINAEPSEIYFTSSGSESNNFALKGIALAQREKRKHIIVSAIEHQSVLNACKSLERLGFSVTFIPVDKRGVVDPDDVKKAIRSDTALASIMMANSEVGTIEPVKEISSICNAHNVLFHTDAVAGAGVIPVDVKDLGVNALSLSATQFYGPQGNAALYVKKGTRILPLIDGGIQEGGKRAGTENVAGIVGMGKAAELAQKELDSRANRICPLRDMLIDRLSEKIDHIVLTGDRTRRLPHHASFCIRFVEGESMLLNLDMQGIAVSSGSACTSKSLKASHVLLAMGFDHALAQGSLVFSLTEERTLKDIEYLLDVFPPIVERLRRMSPLYTQFLEGKDHDVQ